MNIRKHILILCLLCCHALAVMAGGTLVQNYLPISEQDAKKLFNITDSHIKVTGVSYGDFEMIKNRLLASSKTSKSHSFALKVECSEPWSFVFYLQEVNSKQEEISYQPTYEHTLIVDGQVKPQHRTCQYTWYERRWCELTPGEHEIVIMCDYIGKARYPRSIQFKYMFLHAHNIITEAQWPAICGRNGYTKRKCKSCSGYYKEETQPMPAAQHEYDRELTKHGSCMMPFSLFRECIHCGLSEYKTKKHESMTHNFQDGRCVNEDCTLKLPAQNAAGIYQVGDAYELCGLAEQMAAGYIPPDCNIDLTADIVYPEELSHIPIGTSDFPFAGTFDGHGHSISGMQTPILTDMTGLFGVVKGTPRRPAVIANVIIDSNSNLKGNNMTGAIAGRADYCDIVRCVSRGTVRGNSNVGGIVGYSDRECHVIDCAALGLISSKGDGGLLSGTMRRGYIMDSYSSGSLAASAESVLTPTADFYLRDKSSPLRHCFQLDVQNPMAGVTPFSSAQLSDGTLARMLCEKNGRDMPAHWQQGATDGYPMPVFVALTDRPASVAEPQATRAAVASVNDNENEDENEDENENDDDEWHSFFPESDLLADSPDENLVFYDEEDSTLNDFTCHVTTTFRNVPARPMFAAMEGGDATECDVTYCKKDSTVILEYRYTVDGWRYLLTDVTKQYTMPDSVVHLEHYIVEGSEHSGEFLMTSNMVFRPDNSGSEEKISYGVSTRVMDWEVLQDEGKDPTLNYYFYDEDGQQIAEVYSIPSSDMEDEDDFLLPADINYTLDENDRLKDIHYIRTDSLTGESYNMGGQYFLYDEQGELAQVVSYEPVEPFSHEMRQTEYCTIQIYNAEDAPSAIIPPRYLQPGSLDGSPTRASGRIYDLRGNLLRPSSDAHPLKSLPKGLYITRGRKILVHPHN